MSYSSEVLADTPLFYARLGDASGTTMTDSSGNGRNGTYSGSPTLGVTGALAGDSDKAVTFASASSQEASVTYDASWMPQSSFTFEAWVKGTGTSQVIFGRGGTATVGYIGVDASGKLFVQSRNGGGQNQNRVSLTSINDGNWHHIVGVRDAAVLHVYVDGVLDDGAATGVNGSVTTSTENLYVASRGGASAARYNGTIDEVAYYGSALSSTRIAAHYAAGATGPAAASGTGSLTLSGSGAGRAAGTGSAALALSGSGAAAATAGGSGSLSLSGAGAAGGTLAATGSASLTLSGSGEALAPGQAVGDAFLDLFATGDAAATLDGSAAIIGLGVGVAAGATDGAGSLDLIGSMPVTDSGGAFLELLAGGVVVRLYVADTSNALDGLDLMFTAATSVVRPVVAAPPGLVLGEKYDKALPYPEPVMVGGRPT